MNIFNKFYFFLVSDLILEKNLTCFEKILKLFSIKRNFILKNIFLKNVSFIFILKKENILLNTKLLLLNKENILFFMYNKKLYNNKYIDLILKNNFLKLKIKNNFLFFFKFFIFSLQKIIFLIKLKNYYKKCQH